MTVVSGVAAQVGDLLDAEPLSDSSCAAAGGFSSRGVKARFGDDQADGPKQVVPIEGGAGGGCEDEAVKVGMTAWAPVSDPSC
ncbi:hypothetical protein ABT214_08880 [Micromonospora purpureochromogenes]|uniref:hypothetical protein n=1 Tax=Micromonospora purpureochromogenes TaxID=47872 RepID=UPI00332D01D9